MLLLAWSRDLLTCKRQASWGVRQVAWGMWQVAGSGWRAVWQENPSLTTTTTTTQLGRGLSDGRCGDIQGWWKRTGWRWVYGDAGVVEMHGVTGSIYSGDPGVDSLHHILNLISSHHLVIQRILHYIFRIVLITLTLSEITRIHLISWTLTAG